MKKLAKKRLALSTETIRGLDRETLDRAAGGVDTLSKLQQSCDKKCSKAIEE